MAAPTIGRLSSMYMHAWKSGLKTTYYLRSRPATRIQQATVAVPSPAGGSVTGAAATEPTAAELPDDAAVACSLENPETCEACQ
jgi:ribonucleoside-diphosphate reductase alpha chain